MFSSCSSTASLTDAGQLKERVTLLAEVQRLETSMWLYSRIVFTISSTFS